MRSEIKKLKEMSESTMISKSYRDAIKWALGELGDVEQKKETDTKAKYSEDDHKLAEWMDARVKKITKSDKKTNLKSWANTIRLMVEVDKRTHKEITDLFDWCNKHQFWFKNVLSPDKLRQQWEKLSLDRGDSKPIHTQQKSAQQSLIERANSGELYQTTQDYYLAPNGKKYVCAMDYHAGKDPIG